MIYCGVGLGLSFPQRHLGTNVGGERSSGIIVSAFADRSDVKVAAP